MIPPASILLALSLGPAAPAMAPQPMLAVAAPHTLNDPPPKPPAEPQPPKVDPLPVPPVHPPGDPCPGCGLG